MSLLLKVVAEVINPVMASFELDRVQGQNKSTRRFMRKLRLRRITSLSPATRPCERYNPLGRCRH